MKEKKNIQQELEEIAPQLAQLKAQKAKDGFQVPPAYFRQLTDNIMAEVAPGPEHEDTKRPAWWDFLLAPIRNWGQPRPAYALATVALLLLAGLWLFNSGENLDGEMPRLTLNNEELEAYVLANIDEFETDLLIDIYTEDLIESLEEAEKEKQLITEDNLEDILLEMDEEEFESLWEDASFDE